MPGDEVSRVNQFLFCYECEATITTIAGILLQRGPGLLAVRRGEVRVEHGAAGEPRGAAEAEGGRGVGGPGGAGGAGAGAGGRDQGGDQAHHPRRAGPSLNQPHTSHQTNNVLLQNESLKEEIAHLKEELSKIQQKYDTMLTVIIKVFDPYLHCGYEQTCLMSPPLQMYGEKVEEAEELKLDLQDVKEMYKMQIDQLTHSTTTASDQT